MSDSWPELDDTAQLKTNALELSVSELASVLKRSIEDQFGHVRVRGELSGVSTPASGHVYMTLKDDKSSIDTVCWKGVAAHLPFRPEDGIEVIVTGKLTTYAPRSKYQLVVTRMEIAGEGALMALLEKRKKQLAAEGLFDADKKQAIPHLPSVIGVITSPTGAVIRDIIHRLSERFPRHVVVWPVKVQGEGAANEIAAAIHGLNALPADDPRKPDLLIIARGGGSIEDLWSFNEEIVVRAAAASAIPLISSVGHETDTTLIDHAADKRAPTPTAAAEMAVPVRAELQATVLDLDGRLTRARGRMISDRAEQVRQIARALPAPADILGISRQKLDDTAGRLPRALMSVVTHGQNKLSRLIGAISIRRIQERSENQHTRLTELSARMANAIDRLQVHRTDLLLSKTRLIESLSFERTLERGFVMVTAADGRPISSAKLLSSGDQVETHFADGSHGMEVLDSKVSPRKTTAGPKKVNTKAKANKKPKDGRQGDLF